MGCASSVNVQIEENTDNRKILANDKEVGTIKKNDNNEKIDEKSEENQDEDYLEMPTIKQSKNENTDSKTFVNSNTNTNKISSKHNLKINDKYYNSQSTNFKYLKDNKINLVKSNPIMKDNKNKIDEKNKNKFIPLKHPLDESSENKTSELSKLKNLNISEEKEKLNDKNITNTNKNNDINVMSSIEERINNYNGMNNNNNYGDEDEDGVNMGNNGDGEDDDMCNFGQSMDFDKIKNKKNEDENESKEICVIFEIQSTGVKYNININENVKLIELIELFKKKLHLSSFEKPEFVFNTVFLVDFEKKISEYKIGDNSKINVFI